LALIDRRFALTREKRVSALSHFSGTIRTLIEYADGEEITQRVRTFSQASYDEILFAFGALSGVKGLAIVSHGAIGCAASNLYFREKGEAKWFSTNLSEKDSILGGDEILRAVTLRAARTPGVEAVVIVGSPVVEINNDDARAVIAELEEETDAKLIYLNTAGFKSKSPFTGYDIAFHGILKELVEKTDEKREFLNVLSVTEPPRSVASVIKALNALGIRYNLLSSVKAVRNASAARVSVSLNPNDSAYLGKGLEEAFGVKYIDAAAPIGLAATRRFILEIASAFGMSDDAERYVREQEESVTDVIEKKPLRGKLAFISAELSAASGYAALVKDLGGEAVGVSVTEVDLDNREIVKGFDGETTAIIANGQPFETANALCKRPVDYYIGLEGQTAFSSKFGATPISLASDAFYVYDGIRAFARRVETAKRPRTGENALYESGWLKRSGGWYVKREVK
jgi:nitrogenase molybdenum-iron protein alpha chain